MLTMMMSSFRSKMLEPMSCENANPNFPPQGSKVFARPLSLCSGFQIFPFLNIWCFNNAGHGHGPHQIDMLAGSLIDLPWGTAYVEKSPEGVTSKISPWWWWWWYHCGDRKSPSSSSPSPPSSSRPVSKAPLAPARIIIIQWNIIIMMPPGGVPTDPGPEARVWIHRMELGDRQGKSSGIINKLLCYYYQNAES